MISEVAAALDYAGARGLVHRDVKPANILLDADGRVRLTDFGIARTVTEVSELTGTGMTLGTVSYASPEQLAGDAVNATSDQYSLACTAFHLLTGRVPFAGVNVVKVITAHLASPPILPLGRPMGGPVAPAPAPGLASGPQYAPTVHRPAAGPENSKTPSRRGLIGAVSAAAVVVVAVMALVAVLVSHSGGSAGRDGSTNPRTVANDMPWCRW